VAKILGATGVAEMGTTTHGVDLAVPILGVLVVVRAKWTRIMIMVICPMKRRVMTMRKRKAMMPVRATRHLMRIWECAVMDANKVRFADFDTSAQYVPITTYAPHVKRRISTLRNTP